MSDTCSCEHGSCGSSCGGSCGDSYVAPESTNVHGNIKRIFAIQSGKGGVGKSLVTSWLATELTSQGFAVGVLDADVTGPSIPTALGITAKAEGTMELIEPAISLTGIKVMSLNLLLENEKDPVVWRGPVIASTITQFYRNVNWGDLDVLLIDMPPGTGDVPLTVFQSIPIDGVIVVTTPQQLVSMIVAKAVRMANLLNVPLLGLIENMAYFHCPDNGKDYEIFGESKVAEVAAEFNLPILGRVPIDPKVAEAVDAGVLAKIPAAPLEKAVVLITEQILAQTAG